MPEAPLLENGPVRLRHCRYGPMLYLTTDRYVGQSLERYGEFSQGEMDLLAKFVAPGAVALDVGANVGAHTLFFAQRVGAAGLVIAFEPQRVMCQMLCANVALNARWQARVQHAAVGDHEGVIGAPEMDYGQLDNFSGLSIDASAEGGERVPLITIDSLELAACHVIKIDVEGMEREVLQGAVDTISRCRPALYVENDRPDRSAALIAFLLSLDYRLYWHFPPLFNPCNYRGERENIFGELISANMLCLPRPCGRRVRGLLRAASADETWNEAYARWTATQARR